MGASIQHYRDCMMRASPASSCSLSAHQRPALKIRGFLAETFYSGQGNTVGHRLNFHWLIVVGVAPSSKVANQCIGRNKVDRRQATEGVDALCGSKLHFDLFVRDTYVEIGLDWKLAHFATPSLAQRALSPRMSMIFRTMAHYGCEIVNGTSQLVPYVTSASYSSLKQVLPPSPATCSTRPSSMEGISPARRSADRAPHFSVRALPCSLAGDVDVRICKILPLPRKATY